MSHSFPALPYLEAVAKLRYSLSVVAELLHTQLTAGRGEGGHYHTHEARLLIEETKQWLLHSTAQPGGGRAWCVPSEATDETIWSILSDHPH